jgi:single-strand DNA-binding protein
MNLNQATLIGRLTRDPELKSLPNGTSVVNFGLATSRVWKDKDSQKQEEVEFHNCVAFGKTADIIAQYLKKGQLMNVVGRIQTRSWEDKDSGKKLYKTEIVVEQMQMGPKPGGSTAPSETEGPQTAEEAGIEDINPEDIPF